MGGTSEPQTKGDVIREQPFESACHPRGQILMSSLRVILMIEQKCGTVDQGPDQVLGEGEPRLLQLPAAEARVAAERFQPFIGRQRALGLRQLREAAQALGRSARAVWQRRGLRRAPSTRHRGRGNGPAVLPFAPRCDSRRARPKYGAIFSGWPTETGRGALVAEMRNRPSVC